MNHGWLCSREDVCQVCGHRPLLHQSTVGLAQEWTPRAGACNFKKDAKFISGTTFIINTLFQYTMHLTTHIHHSYFTHFITNSPHIFTTCNIFTNSNLFIISLHLMYSLVYTVYVNAYCLYIFTVLSNNTSTTCNLYNIKHSTFSISCVCNICTMHIVGHVFITVSII